MYLKYSFKHQLRILIEFEIESQNLDLRCKLKDIKTNVRIFYDA